jgi:hypothetical protein
VKNECELTKRDNRLKVKTNYEGKNCEVIVIKTLKNGAKKAGDRENELVKRSGRGKREKRKLWLVDGNCGVIERGRYKENPNFLLEKSERKFVLIQKRKICVNNTKKKKNRGK